MQGWGIFISIWSFVDLLLIFGHFSSLQCSTWNKSLSITGHVKVTDLWSAGPGVDCIIPRWRHVHFYLVFLLLSRWWPDNGGYTKLESPHEKDVTFEVNQITVTQVATKGGHTLIPITGVSVWGLTINSLICDFSKHQWGVSNKPKHPQTSQMI